MGEGALRRDSFITIAATWLLTACAAAGCSGGDAGSQGPDFSACDGTPAVVYHPGLTQTSGGGGFQAAVTAVMAAGQAGSPPDDAPAIGLNDWTVAITDDGDAPATALTVTASKPWMPQHGHSALMAPVVTAQDGGIYDVSGIDFFMAGYWEMTLTLQPPDAAADQVVFSICVPQ